MNEVTAKIFYFGCLDVPGHYLYGPGGISASHSDRQGLPFRYEILDGGLLPGYKQPIQGKLHHAIVNGWTIVSMWDRSGDRRPNSNSSFIVEGMLTRDEVTVLAKLVFPKIIARIEGFKE